MTIQLFVEPRKVYTWEDFIETKPPYSIALDGIVDAQTIRQIKGPYANFDHHSKVDRLSTRSTSGQIYIEINLGLFETFRKRGKPTANIYVNDPDEDTCLAWWLLKNNNQVVNNASDPVNKLVHCEDLLDTTSGAYPLGDKKIRREMAWIFEPYNNARYKGNIAEMEEVKMKNIILTVEDRIDKYVRGEGEELKLKGKYEVIGGGENWVLVKENGTKSRKALYQNGIKAFASILKEKEDGSIVYALGKRSPWIPFDIPRIYEALNEIDDNITETNRWNGSDIIGGSPKETGSRIKPEQLEEIINGLE